MSFLEQLKQVRLRDSCNSKKCNSEAQDGESVAKPKEHSKKRICRSSKETSVAKQKKERKEQQSTLSNNMKKGKESQNRKKPTRQRKKDKVSKETATPPGDMHFSFDEGTTVEQNCLEFTKDIRAKHAHIANQLIKSGGNTENMNCSDIMELTPEQNLNEIASYLYRGPQNTLTTPAARQAMSYARDTVVVTRAWEESFMKEAAGSERSCVNGQRRNCMASKIRCNGLVDANFSLVEFYTQAEYREIEKGGWKWPDVRKQCILCLRASVYSRFMNARCCNVGVTPDVCMSPIGNIVGEPGEYCSQDVFVSGPSKYEGIIIPVVLPSITQFLVHRVNGIRYLQQLLPKPENMHTSFFF